VELLLGALAAEPAQAPQREVDLPHVEDQIAPVLAEAPLGRHLHGGAAAARAADPEPGRVGARVSERRGAAGADPAVAAVVALLLLAQALLEAAAQLVEVEPLEHASLLLAEPLEQARVAQPVEKPALDGQRLRSEE